MLNQNVCRRGRRSGSSHHGCGDPVEDSASTLHTTLLQHRRQLSMSSYTTSTNTYVILKYSRSWPDLGGGQSSEWEHVNSPRLRIRLCIVTPSDSAEGHPRYCLKVFDDLSSSQTLQSSQTLSENVWVSRSSWFAGGEIDPFPTILGRGRSHQLFGTTSSISNRRNSSKSGL